MPRTKLKIVDGQKPWIITKDKGKVIAPFVDVVCPSCDRHYAIEWWQWEAKSHWCDCSGMSFAPTSPEVRQGIEPESCGAHAQRRFNALTQAQRDYLVSAYVGGVKMEEIYKRYRVGRSVLRQWLVLLGVELKARPCYREARRKADYPLADEQIASIKKQWADGVSIERIGQSVGLNRPQFMFWRAKLNLPARGSSKPISAPKLPRLLWECCK